MKKRQTGIGRTGKVMMPKTNKIQLLREIELETGRAGGIEAVF